MNVHDELTKRKFKKAGQWLIGENENKYRNDLDYNDMSRTCFLYAFVIGNEVIYLGKSDKKVSDRLTQYARNKKDNYKGKHVKRMRETIGIEKEDGIKSDVEIYLYFPEILLDGKIIVDNKDLNLSRDDRFIKKGILLLLEDRFINEFQSMNQCKYNTQKPKRDFKSS
jgi:hypothetical protein